MDKEMDKEVVILWKQIPLQMPLNALSMKNRS